MEVMQLVKDGLPNKAIAARLHISSETIKKHVRNIFEKLGATNKIEALNRLNGN
jgi:DNA-binding NarL/FixJ family response regulator